MFFSGYFLFFIHKCFLNNKNIFTLDEYIITQIAILAQVYLLKIFFIKYNKSKA